SPRSSRRWPPTGKSRRTRRSPKWTHCGTRPRRGSEACSFPLPQAGRGELLHAGSTKILQIDELLRRRQRRVDNAPLPNEGDAWAEAAEIDFGLARQHAAIGLEIKRKRRTRDIVGSAGERDDGP